MNLIKYSFLKINFFFIVKIKNKKKILKEDRSDSKIKCRIEITT